MANEVFQVKGITPVRGTEVAMTEGETFQPGFTIPAVFLGDAVSKRYVQPDAVPAALREHLSVNAADYVWAASAKPNTPEGPGGVTVGPGSNARREADIEIYLAG